MSAMRACSSADSIIDGGLLGGGYGPTRILPTTPPSHSLAPAMAAATTANPMDSFGEAAPMRANAVAAAASATMLATLSTFRSMVMFLSATEHDLHDAVWALNLSSRIVLLFSCGGNWFSIPEGHAGWPPAISTIHFRKAPT